ncbi:hypothetical protein [Rhizobium laguerreae]|uniref:hypothetical protein n=1 Tax=Rhizobium laguerreae TaxID=1076926 RepID=UPI001C929B17|nr:hypothetical protein [Rhizobium laguerreae]MBY3158020.1 hypothetical protein [Rhizobium laguerreae]MBY3447035.1 hypothetical protein [Rhizobium laguerreae]
MEAAQLLIVGCGSLARETLLPLTITLMEDRTSPVNVVLASRDLRQAEWLVTLARSRVKTNSSLVTFTAASIDWDDENRIADLLNRIEPKVIFHTASYQSAWSLGAPNLWSKLVKQGGYAVTTALQAALLSKLIRSMAQLRSNAILINACYPDIVNSLFMSTEIKIFSGVGNINIVFEVLRQSHQDEDSIRVLAGHWDVNQLMLPCESRSEPPLAWINGQPINQDELIRLPTIMSDSSLNSLSAYSSAKLIASFFRSPRPVVFHLPGPNGMIGGYPVLVDGDVARIDLPPDMDSSKAIAWNMDRAYRDGGCSTEDGYYRFSEATAEVVGKVSRDLAGGFETSDLDEAVKEFLSLRSFLSNKHCDS